MWVISAIHDLVVQLHGDLICLQRMAVVVTGEPHKTACTPS